MMCRYVYLSVCMLDDSTRVVLSGAQDYINASHIIVSAITTVFQTLVFLNIKCSAFLHKVKSSNK